MEEVGRISPVGSNAAHVTGQVDQHAGFLLLEHPPDRGGVGQIIVRAGEGYNPLGAIALT